LKKKKIFSLTKEAWQDIEEIATAPKRQENGKVGLRSLIEPLEVCNPKKRLLR
jgi:hypothetical protein